MPFWSEDERQVYLIGLRSFARGEWPYFGADVVWTGGQLPGALQALLIRWPLAIWHAPEAPFVFLGALSFATLSLFAWYLGRRLPDVPRWLIWGGLLTLPWTLNFSAHVINTSYVLPGAILFFVGFFEGMPALSRRIVPFGLAWGLMGAGLLFVLQIHMSWVLLPPYVLVAALGVVFGRADQLPQSRGRSIVLGVAGFAIGAAATGACLMPTIWRYGLGAGDSAVLHFSPQNPLGIVTTAARILSFASFETNRFLGMSTAERLLLLFRMPWLLPFVAVVATAGLVQPLWMAVTAVRRDPGGGADWTRVRLLLAGTIALVYFDYFFSVRGPQAHAFYVVFPVAALFASSCWQVAARAASGQDDGAGRAGRRWERVAGVVMICGLVMHAGLAIDRWSSVSLYAHRDLVTAAIDRRNDRLLGDRRDTRIETPDRAPRPIDRVPDSDAYLAARPENDLQVVTSTWRRAAFDVSVFSVTVTHHGRAAAWIDLRYETVYTGAGGQVIATRQGVLKQILEPGETRTWTEVADDFVPAGSGDATITITGAERAIPAGTLAIIK
jgi:hypothetical protein